MKNLSYHYKLLCAISLWNQGYVKALLLHISSGISDLLPMDFLGLFLIPSTLSAEWIEVVIWLVIVVLDWSKNTWDLWDLHDNIYLKMFMQGKCVSIYKHLQMYLQHM